MEKNPSSDLAKVAHFASQTKGDPTTFRQTLQDKSLAELADLRNLSLTADEYILLANAANAAHRAAGLDISEITPDRAAEFTQNVNFGASMEHLNKKRSQK